MVIEDVLVVVEDVAGAAEVVVVEDVVLGDSDASGSSDGTEKAAEVELVLLVALVLVVVLVGATVTAGSDASSAPSTDGEPRAPTALSAATEVVVAFSGCMVAAVPATVAVVGAELLVLLFDEQLDASKTAANTVAM